MLPWAHPNHDHCQVTSSTPVGPLQTRPDDQTLNVSGEVQSSVYRSGRKGKEYRTQ